MEGYGGVQVLGCGLRLGSLLREGLVGARLISGVELMPCCRCV